MNDKAGEKRTIGDMLKHPLVNVVVGFLLTGVLGTTLTQYYIVQREKQKQQHELATTRKESIATLSTLNAEYLARAGMLLAAVDRGDEDSIKKLRAVFDDAAMRWQIEKPPTILAARDVLPEEIYLQFRDHLNKGFRERFMVPLGECLENAKEELAEGGDVASVLPDCGAHDYLTQAMACSRVLLDMLHEISGYTVEGKTEEALQANRDTYRVALQQACSMTE